MTSFWTLHHHHITCELIPAVLVILTLTCAWRHDHEAIYHKRIAFRLSVFVLGSVACWLASGHPRSPLVALVPLAIFGGAHLLDSLVYALGTPAERRAQRTPPADGGAKEKPESDDKATGEAEVG